MRNKKIILLIIKFNINNAKLKNKAKTMINYLFKISQKKKKEGKEKDLLKCKKLLNKKLIKLFWLRKKKLIHKNFLLKEI